MEKVTWKAGVTSTRMIERMRFLRAYWGRSTFTAKHGAPDREYPIAHVIVRCVERVYDELILDLSATVIGDRKGRICTAEQKAKAEWWLKYARDGRNGDPFPGVSYPAEEKNP